MRDKTHSVGTGISILNIGGLLSTSHSTGTSQYHSASSIGPPNLNIHIVKSRGGFIIEDLLNSPTWYIGAKYILQDFQVKIGGGLIVEVGVLRRHYGNTRVVM